MSMLSGMGSRAMAGYFGAVGRFNGLPMAAKAGLIGAGMGGVYGATMGRDPGQSRLGGFLSGAAMGGALGAAGGRYGPGAARAARPSINAMMGSFASGAYRGMGSSAMGALRAGGRSTMGAMRSDAARAAGYIGRSSLSTNSGFSRITGLFR